MQPWRALVISFKNNEKILIFLECLSYLWVNYSHFISSYWFKIWNSMFMSFVYSRTEKRGKQEENRQAWLPSVGKCGTKPCQGRQACRRICEKDEEMKNFTAEKGVNWVSTEMKKTSRCCWRWSIERIRQ